MERIEKDLEKLKLMFRIKENGYKQNFEKFKEVNNFIEIVGSLPLEYVTRKNVVGGINMKNKLAKAISVGLASLIAMGSPVSYASHVKVPHESTSSSNNLFSKKLLKIAGISTTTIVLCVGSLLGINWLYKNYYSKSLSKQNEETSKQSKVHELDALLAAYKQQNQKLEIKITAIEENVRKQEELIAKARAETKDPDIENAVAPYVEQCRHQKQEIAKLRAEIKENSKQQEQLIKQNT